MQGFAIHQLTDWPINISCPRFVVCNW